MRTWTPGLYRPAFDVVVAIVIGMRMPRSNDLIHLLLALVLLFCGDLSGKDLQGNRTRTSAKPHSDPQEVVQRVSEGLRRVLREDRRLLETDPAYVHRLVDELFLPNLDFRRTCALVLGPYWKRATAVQRDAFMVEFKAFLINTYATAVNELSEWEIRYLPLDLQPGDQDIVVRTRVLYSGGRPIQADYRMHYEDERWLVYDVEVAGIGFIEIYRSSFLHIVRRKGVDGLIDELATRNAKRRRSWNLPTPGTPVVNHSDR